VHGIVRVLVGERVDVHFDPRRNWEEKATEKSESSQTCFGNITTEYQIDVQFEYFHSMNGTFGEMFFFSAEC